MKSIKIDDELWRRVEEYARKAGYSSPVEFIEHVLEKELSNLEQQSSREEIERRLKGLGYVE